MEKFINTFLRLIGRSKNFSIPELNKKFPVCIGCNSPDIYCNGDATWVYDEQRWVFHPSIGVDEMCWCNQCETTNAYKWVTEYEHKKELLKHGQ